MSTVSLEDALDTPDPQMDEKVEQAPHEQATPEPIVAQDGTGDEPAAPPAAEQSEQPVKMVPVAAIEAERRKRQQAEREREALMDRMAELMARQEQPVQQHRQEVQQQPEIPDPITDPAGYTAYMQEHVNRQLRSNFVNSGYHTAKVQYGADRVDTALQAAKASGVSQHFAWKADDPWGELVQWYDRRLVHTEYGTSPDSVEEKVLAKFGLNRAELLAQRQAAAAGQAPVVAAQPVRSPAAPPPTSLASVTSAAPRKRESKWNGPASLDEILG